MYTTLPWMVECKSCLSRRKIYIKRFDQKAVVKFLSGEASCKVCGEESAAIARYEHSRFFLIYHRVILGKEKTVLKIELPKDEDEDEEEKQTPPVKRL